MAEIIARRYEIIKSIGHGGMADVYLALDKILNREVAIKVMKADISSDPISLERFRREANASCKLSHPNVVDIYDVGDDGDKHYIVMEYVKGHTLKQVIKHRGAIAPKEAVWLIKQLASALLEAHRNGLIHRDIKSQNVLIKNDGTVKLADFGIAILNNSLQLTSKDSVLGSVHYLAPELAKGGSASMKSDIYSLGIVFYEILAGDVPFKGDTPVQIALKHVKEELPNLKKFNSDIPQSVINIILKATAKDPNKRYDNIALMLKDLNQCLDKDKRDCKPINLNTSNDKKMSNYHIPESNLKEKINQKNINTQKKFSTILLILISLLSIIAVLLILFINGVFNNDKDQFITIPNIANKNYSEVIDELDTLGITYSYPVTYEYNDNYEEGHIISTIPEIGSKIEKGKKIRLIVSNGPFPEIDNYVGKSINEVKKSLIGTNFNIITEEIEKDGEPGKIIEQSLNPGSKYDPSISYDITFKVIKNNVFTIPYGILGQNIDDARQSLLDLGIKDESIILQKVDKESLDDDIAYQYASGTVCMLQPYENEKFIDNGENKLLLIYY